ncbi:MAG: CoA-binding protein, partial [Alphaproteobacteria bacterium]|nr:CoA-binding protein [Alphaproteobacteria bacterium]
MSRAPSDLSRLFDPRGIAIIGASTNPTRIGGQPVRYLLDYGFKGGIYPVNPKYQTVAGLRCYADVTAIAGPVDIAVLAVPAAEAVAAVAACGRKGVAFAILYTAGFAETGAEGARLQVELARAAEAGGVRIVGPNCQGMLNLPKRMFLGFGSIFQISDLRIGPVSMATQSGGFGFSVVLSIEAQGVGFQSAISTGNEVGVTTPELFAAFVDDPETRVIAGYIEGVADGAALMAAGRKALRAGKPILLWKSGNTVRGKEAALSHTANMTGSYDIYRAAFAQAGIIEVKDIDELADYARAFATGRLPAGNRIATISISGGAAILHADRCTELGLELPRLDAATKEGLRKVIPSFASAENPVDTTATVFNDVRMFTEAIELVLSDPNVDQLAILAASMMGEIAATCMSAVATAQRRFEGKPILVTWTGRRERAEEAYRLVEEAQIPVYTSPVRAANAAAALARFAGYRRRQAEVEPRATESRAPLPPLPAGSGALDEAASKRILTAIGIPTPREVTVAPGADPVAAAAGLAYPLAVKILSPDIAHKTEIGGVRLNVGTPEALRVAVGEVQGAARARAPAARVTGTLIAEMIGDGAEAIIGVIDDPVFGPVVAVGLGGIFTEVLHDLSYRVAP